MVDRVELDALDEPDDVRELERRHALRVEQDRDPGHEVVEVRDLGQDVVADDEVGVPALAHQALGEVAAEELRQRRHAARLRGRGHVVRGLHAEDGHAAGHEVLEQVAVVARQLDDEARPAQVAALDHRVGVLPARAPPSCRRTTRSRRTRGRCPRGRRTPAAARAGTRGRSARGAGRTAPSARRPRGRRTTRTGAAGRGRRTCRGAGRRRSGTRPGTRSGRRCGSGGCSSPAERIVRRRRARTAARRRHAACARRRASAPQWNELLLKVTPAGGLPCEL